MGKLQKFLLVKPHMRNEKSEMPQKISEIANV